MNIVKPLEWAIWRYCETKPSVLGATSSIILIEGDVFADYVVSNEPNGYWVASLNKDRLAVGTLEQCIEACRRSEADAAIAMADKVAVTVTKPGRLVEVYPDYELRDLVCRLAALTQANCERLGHPEDEAYAIMVDAEKLQERST